jgi:DNA-binding NtrC family response regulator
VRFPAGFIDREEFVMPAKNRVLVVDDEEALRIVLSAELEGEGYQIASAADGQEAINILATKEFDLILLDIKMPNVDGFEVLKYVKEHCPKTKVVMLTGFADLKNAIESKKLGAEDFVSKPYDLVDLLTTVERVLTGV